LIKIIFLKQKANRQLSVSLLMKVLLLLTLGNSSKGWAQVGPPKVSIYGMGPLLEETLQIWSGSPQEMGDFSDNPILGRQTCPSLTRLNLVKGTSEPLLLASLTEQAGENSSWTFTIKQGLFWWGGASVTVDDVMEFVKVTLPNAAQHAGAGLWPVPEFKLIKRSPDTFVLQWSEKPVFGPFVINGIPLARVPKGDQTGLKGNRIECAGLYIPEVSAHGTKLAISAHYKSSKPLPQIEAFIKPSSDVPEKDSGAEVSLVLNGIWNYRKDAQCTISADEPMITALLWNQTLGVTEDAEFRRLIDQLIPRENIAEIIGRKFVTPIDSPIIRGYPNRSESKGFPLEQSGGKESQKTRSHIEKVALRLQQIGYARPDPRGPRLDRKGKSIQLSIVTRSKELGLIEKILEDVLSSVGIGARFVVNSTRHPEELNGYNAILSTFRVDWPGSNLLPTLHSRVTQKGIFKNFRGNAQLDQVLEKYALQLTNIQPDFGVIDDIERELRMISGISVLMQHRLCLDIRRKGLQMTQESTNQNPDWFRNLLLTL
jgi:hypothetical protein